MTRESQILHQAGLYWVSRGAVLRAPAYIVWRDGVTHATSESCYSLTPAGLSVAVARCNYLAKQRG